MKNEIQFLRIWQILGNKKTNPPVPPMIPVSESTWWEGVKDGRFPKPIKLSPRVTVWRFDEIKKIGTTKF